jgi:hypothetical protein
MMNRALARFPIDTPPQQGVRANTFDSYRSGAVGFIDWLGVTNEFNKGEERIANCISSGVNAPSVEGWRIHVADIIELVKPSFVSSPPAEASGGSGKLLHGSAEVIKSLEFARVGLHHKCLKPEVKSGEQLRSSRFLLAAVGMLSCLALTLERQSVSSDPTGNDNDRGNDRGECSSNNGRLRAGHVEQ